MAGVLYAVLVLPTLTKVVHHTKIQRRPHVISPTKLYRNPCSLERTPLVFLAWSTNAYHVADLSLNQPCETFTNLYHRGEGDWIKPNTPSRVGQYRHSGCHMGSMVKGYRSRSPSEPLGVVARWVVGVTKKKLFRLVMVA